MEGTPATSTRWGSGVFPTSYKHIPSCRISCMGISFGSRGRPLHQWRRGHRWEWKVQCRREDSISVVEPWIEPGEGVILTLVTSTWFLHCHLVAHTAVCRGLTLVLGWGTQVEIAAVSCQPVLTLRLLMAAPTAHNTPAAFGNTMQYPSLLDESPQKCNLLNRLGESSCN